MNAKTERQIENMKNQTIGVEDLPPTSSEQADTKTRQAETATAPGQHGMHRAENGNFRETFPLPEQTAKNANW